MTLISPLFPLGSNSLLKWLINPFLRNNCLFLIPEHELKAFSASWAYFIFIPLDEVIKAVFGPVHQHLLSSI